ncbi:MAG: TonB-dependent receptor [Gemmatimonas sp.]|nr:TonB-dependent receptor [Gemmatimonas sp.]
MWSMTRSRRLLLRALFTTVLLLTTTSIADAQETASIAGTVVDEQTAQPISSAQVFIPGIDQGALTDQSGRYVLIEVPAGTHTLSVQRIGYRSTELAVTLVAGQSLEQDIQISQEALALDEIIVTGTAGGTQRRAIGNSVASVTASDITQTSQINSVQDLLTGQAPGLDFAVSAGNIGAGSPIRVRGVSSLELGQQPLIYVDGVRVNNATDAGPFLGNGAASGGEVSVLEDFSPDEIESIEIIKGPAAATLYGTEASAGVIQIITKKGVQGAPQFSLSVSQGANYLSDPSGKLGTQWGISPTGELIEGFEGYPNIYEYETEVLGNDPLQYGRAQSYSLDVRGGTETVRYFLSGGWQDDEGIVDYNFNERLNLRGNIGVTLSSALALDVSTGFLSGLTGFAQQLTEPGGIWDAMMWAQPELKDTDRRGFMRYTPEELATVEATREYERFTGSATLTHRMGDRLTQRLIVGMDRASDENQVLVPRHQLGTASAFGGIGLGDVQLSRPINKEVTFDYAASLNYGLSDALRFTTSVGAQYYSSELNQINGHGSVLASPALRSIEGTTRVDIGQLFVQNKSMGVYFQQQLSWNDRIFLTGAVRADDNSAFGSDFDAAIYPKVSGTWLISEEGFWNIPLVSTLRLRSALGQAGRQPATFDAVTLYEPKTGRGGNPAMIPANLGNPNVGPEVGTELEVGFDYGLLEDRISGDFTYFHQWTTEALANLPLLPSLGFSGTEAVNLGQLNNWGWEATVQARLVERPSWALDMGLSGDHSYNKIVDLGGRLPTFELKEGLPFPAVASDVIVSAEFDEFGDPVNVMCDAGTGRLGLERGGPTVPCAETAGYELLLGPAFSPYNFSVDASLYLLGRSLQLFAMAAGEHGAWRESTVVWCRFAGCFTNTRASLAQDDPIYVEGVVFQQRHPYDQTLIRAFDASFWKLRRVGARYEVPNRWIANTGASRASISISGTNLWTIWQKTKELSGAPVVDPEFAGIESVTDTDLGMMPPLSGFSVRFDVSF